MNAIIFIVNNYKDNYLYRGAEPNFLRNFAIVKLIT